MANKEPTNVCYVCNVLKISLKKIKISYLMIVGLLVNFFIRYAPASSK